MSRSFSTFFFLIFVLVVPLYVLATEVNQGSGQSLELIGENSVIVNGSYLLRFDMPPPSQPSGVWQPKESLSYSILTKEGEEKLLKAVVVVTPPSLRVVERKTGIELIDHSEKTNFRREGRKTFWTRVDSKVYKLSVRLTIAPALDSRTASNPSPETAKVEDVLVRFPSAIEIRQKLGATTPLSMPEIRFQVTRWPSAEAKVRAEEAEARAKEKRARDQARQDARVSIWGHLCGLVFAAIILGIATRFRRRLERDACYSIICLTTMASLILLYLVLDDLLRIIGACQLALLIGFVAAITLLPIYFVKRRPRTDSAQRSGSVPDSISCPDGGEVGGAMEAPANQENSSSSRLSVQDSPSTAQALKHRITPDRLRAIHRTAVAPQATQWQQGGGPPQERQHSGPIHDGEPRSQGQSNNALDKEAHHAGKTTVKVKEVMTDVKAGMGDVQLMQKYGLSAKQLVVLYNKLTEAGFIRKPHA